MSIADIQEPVQRFLAFIEERENIRLRRKSGKPWPWTQDYFLQTYRFTNIHREHDAVSIHYQKTIRDRYTTDPLVFPGTVLYRWFNRISTCDAYFNQPDFSGSSAFERFIASGDLDILFSILHKLPTPHVTGAFIINGKPGYEKGQGVLFYFQEWMKLSWKKQWELWVKNPPFLSDIYEWIKSNGLGSFMRAQIIADLKYLPVFLDVDDWWTWAAPGPGSMKGLNVVLKRDMNAPWRESDWLIELTRLNERVTPHLEEIGIGRLHNQDLQNCLCEFSKYTKVSQGLGRPRQVFRHV